MGEPTLRGKRGKDVYDGNNKPISSTPAEPGEDLYSTIDTELEEEIQDLFTHVEVPYDSEKPPHCDTIAMHGAAVVMDIESGDV